MRFDNLDIRGLQRPACDMWWTSGNSGWVSLNVQAGDAFVVWTTTGEIHILESGVIGDGITFTYAAQAIPNGSVFKMYVWGYSGPLNMNASEGDLIVHRLAGGNSSFKIEDENV
jgi:hypothetical protein